MKKDKYDRKQKEFMDTAISLLRKLLDMWAFDQIYISK